MSIYEDIPSWAIPTSAVIPRALIIPMPLINWWRAGDADFRGIVMAYARNWTGLIISANVANRLNKKQRRTYLPPLENVLDVIQIPTRTNNLRISWYMNHIIIAHEPFKNTSKTGLVDGTPTTANARRCFVRYSRQMVWNGHRMPTSCIWTGPPTWKAIVTKKWPNLSKLLSHCSNS